MPKKILHVIDKFSMDGKTPSSCAYLFRDWSQFYDRDRYRVDYCGLKHPDPGSLMLQTYVDRVIYLKNGKYSYNNVRDLIMLVHKEKFDLLHLHGYSSANFGRIAAHQTGIPAIVHEHAILKVQPHQYIADRMLRNYTIRGIAVAGAVKDFMIRGRGIPAEKISVIYNSVVLNRFQNIDKSLVEEVKAEWGISAANRVVGTVTRLREEKGNRFLLEAIPYILEEFPDSRFVIAGDGPLRSNLEKLAQELGIDKAVIFTGFRKDIPVVLAALDVKVMPSLIEGCPYALIEAMASAKPIVATRVGGMQEVIRDRENGLLVTSKDPRALSEGIKYLLGHEKDAIAFAKQAQEDSRHFGAESIVRKHEAVYDEVLGIR